MLVNLSSFIASDRTLTPERSKSLLYFCHSCGASLFTVNFPFVKGEESERLMNVFYERLERFTAGDKVLECIESSGFERQPSWLLNEASIELILRETDGDLFAYNILYLPEDWLLYRDDTIFFQLVTHEQEATLRLSAAEYEKFRSLGIPHSLGPAKWTGLAEQPNGE
jgi:hypothetical protein